MEAHILLEDHRIVVSGDVDIAIICGLSRAVETALARLPAGADLDVDLSHVTFIDSGGLGALVTVRTIAHSRGAGLRFVESAPCVHRLIAMTGLDRMLGTSPVHQPTG